MTTPRQHLETETCTRCGGSGEYSYCQMYGRTCFKCAGSGKQYTKRGAAAARWLADRRKVLAKDVKFGDWLLLQGVPGFSGNSMYKVDAMYTRLRSGSHTDSKTGETVYSNHLALEGRTKAGETCGQHVFPDSTVILCRTKEANEAMMLEAIAYQETLTKAGKPRKRNAA